jgi:hypothetical protein
LVKRDVHLFVWFFSTVHAVPDLLSPAGGAQLALASPENVQYRSVFIHILKSFGFAGFPLPGCRRPTRF